MQNKVNKWNKNVLLAMDAIEKKEARAGEREPQRGAGDANLNRSLRISRDSRWTWRRGTVYRRPKDQAILKTKASYEGSGPADCPWEP